MKEWQFLDSHWEFNYYHVFHTYGVLCCSIFEVEQLHMNDALARWVLMYLRDSWEHEASGHINLYEPRMRPLNAFFGVREPITWWLIDCMVNNMVFNNNPNTV